jgi:hypothetical protein
MSITGPGSINAANLAAQTNMFSQLNKLSLQLGTGEASQTYAGLGPQAGLALSLNSQLAALNGYSTTATTVGTTLTLAQSVLTQLGDAGTASSNQSISKTRSSSTTTGRRRHSNRLQVISIRYCPCSILRPVTTTRSRVKRLTPRRSPARVPFSTAMVRKRA